MTTLELIGSHYQTLSPSQKQVADYVLQYPDKVMISSMYDLSTACHVSEPTIMRFLHKLKFNSYQVFRVNIAQEVGAKTTRNLYSEEIHHEDSFDVICQKVAVSTSDSLQNCLQRLNMESLLHMVDHCLHARHILVIGVGASFALAYDMSHKLQRLGLFSHCSNDPHMINIMCSNLSNQDVLFAFSHSGESLEILSGIEMAKKNGAYIAGITSYDHSSMVTECDHVLLSSAPETKYRSDALTSRIIQMTIIDVFYLCAASKIGSQAEQNINKTRMAVAKNKR